MKYYKNNQNQIFADEDYVADRVDSGFIKITETQANDILNEKTQNQLIEELKAAVQAELDSNAQDLGYDDINSIGKYIGYDNAFRIECEALGGRTSSSWSYCYVQLALVESGGRTIPTPEVLIAELPVRIV